MGLFENKKGLILGIANDSSIAAIIAHEIMKQGAVCGVTHLPDKPDDEKKKEHHARQQGVARIRRPVSSSWRLSTFNQTRTLQAVMEQAAASFGKLDFILHSIAFAPLDDLKCATVECSREGFKMAMDVSAYSLIAVANAAKDIMNEDSAIACMTYFGGEKCVPGYNMMGVCKAALESITKYLAFDLGPKKIRVNALECRSGQNFGWSCGGRQGNACRCTKEWHLWDVTFTEQEIANSVRLPVV